LLLLLLLSGGKRRGIGAGRALSRVPRASSSARGGVGRGGRRDVHNLLQVGFGELDLGGLDLGRWFGDGGGSDRSGLISNGGGLCFGLRFGLGRFRFNRSGSFRDGFGFGGFGGLGSRSFLGKGGHNLGSCGLSEHAGPGLDLRSGGLVEGLGNDGLLREYGPLLGAVGLVVFVRGGFFGGHRQLLVLLGSRSVGGMGCPGTSATAPSLRGPATTTSSLGSIAASTGSSSGG
jgi:hypothetical protein